MARLTARERAKLPDSAFAYVDSAGKRSLPINDESHVRNALSRFGQVQFEDDHARDTARKKLLNAAKRHGIVPIGFINAELRSADRKSAAGRMVIELGRVESSADLETELQRTLRDRDLALLRWSKPEGTYVGCDGAPVALPHGDSGREVSFLQSAGRPLMAVVHHPDALGTPEITEAVMAAVHLVTGRELLDEIDDRGVATEGLPDGTVTFLLTDIEGSTPLLGELGSRYTDVLRQTRTNIREAVLSAGGRQVEARADEFVAVFTEPAAALTAAVDAQRRMAATAWPGDRAIRIRIGVHTGEITLTDSGYVGVTVHTAARIMSAAHGGQILASAATCDAAGSQCTATLTSLGAFELRGLTDVHQLVQVSDDGLETEFPPPAV